MNDWWIDFYLFAKLGFFESLESAKTTND